VQKKGKELRRREERKGGENVKAAFQEKKKTFKTKRGEPKGGGSKVSRRRGAQLRGRAEKKGGQTRRRKKIYGGKKERNYC